MDRDYIPIPRVELPAEWTPEGTICALVPIPDDPEFLSALVGLIDQLRLSRTFARDVTKTGASIVARTWASALNTQPIATIDCEGVVTVFDVRQRPDEPCILEKSTDGGETWVQFADLTLCPPTVMIGSDGKTIVYWCPTCGPDGGPGWVPLPNPDDTYDPAHDDPQTDHSDWPDEGTDPGCVFAANVTEAFKSVFERVDFGLETGALSQVIWVAANGLYGIANRLLTKKIQEILQAIAANVLSDYADWHDDYESFDWQEMTDKFCCFFDDSGMVTETSFAFGMASIAGKSGPLWDLTKVLLSVIGPNGLNNAATYAGITAEDCDCDCDNCQDFTMGPEGYSVLGGHGEWTDGLGYTGTLDPVTGDLYIAEIQGEAIPGEWDHIRVSWYFTGSYKVIDVLFDGVNVYHAEYGAVGADADIPVTGPVSTIKIKATQDDLNNDVRITSVCYYPAA